VARTLMGDVGNGKGSRRRLGADDDKYRENWSKIFGNKENNNGKEPTTENDETMDEASQGISQGKTQ
jgi:hypothetical protein